MKTASDYERFVVDVLKPQLASFVKSCDEINEENNGYDEIRATLLKQETDNNNNHNHNINHETTTSVKTDNTSTELTLTHCSGPPVDIGENCLVQTEIYDPNEIYIHVGMGFHVSLPREEALPLIDSRQKILSAKLEHMQGRCQEIATYINEVLPIISELKRVEEAEKKTEGWS